MTIVMAWPWTSVKLGGGRSAFRFGPGPLSQMRQQFALAQADGFGRHLDKLIVFDIGDGLLQRHRHDGREPDRLVLGGGVPLTDKPKSRQSHAESRAPSRRSSPPRLLPSSTDMRNKNPQKSMHQGGQQRPTKTKPARDMASLQSVS